MLYFLYSFVNLPKIPTFRFVITNSKERNLSWFKIIKIVKRKFIDGRKMKNRHNFNILNQGTVCAKIREL